MYDYIYDAEKGDEITKLKRAYCFDKYVINQMENRFDVMTIVVKYGITWNVLDWILQKIMIKLFGFVLIVKSNH